MRNVKANRKVGRASEQGISGLRGLATSLVNSDQGHIVTTVGKAKQLEQFLGKAITLARKAYVLGEDATEQKVYLCKAAARYFIAGTDKLEDDCKVKAPGGGWSEGKVIDARVAAVRRLVEELGERYKDYNGGYTRIIRVGRRTASNAEMAVIELVDNPDTVEVKDLSNMIADETRIDNLSDAEVIALAEFRMPDDQQEELEDLISREKSDGLSESETKRLDALMDIHDEALLKKSEAFGEAAKRGLLGSLSMAGGAAARAGEMRANADAR